MSRRFSVIDTEPFKKVMQEALAAYRIDSSYAVAMARQASVISKKRAVWKLRLELRAAEQKAIQQCVESKPFVCNNQGPCGTGACKFSSGDLGQLDLPPVKPSSKTSVRPQVSEFPDYNIESAVRPLQILRSQKPTET